MGDLALDPVTGDLDFSSGGLRLTDDTSTESIAQRLRIRLSLILGEYVLDRSEGFPWQNVMGVKDSGASLTAMARRAILTCPGVTRLNSFSFFLSPDRSATLTYQCDTVVGVIDETGFVPYPVTS